jgi:hypothetical protein
MKRISPISVLLTAALVVAVVWLGRSATFYAEALASSYFAFTLGGVLIIHFRVRPSWLDAGLVLLGAAALAVLDLAILHYQPTILCGLAFAGLASLAVLGARVIWSTGETRKLYLLCFIPATCFVASEYFASNLLDFTGKMHPKLLDLYLYAFDASLRVQLPFRVGQLLATWPAIRTLSLLCYAALSFPVALIYAGKVVRVRERAFSSFLAFAAMGPIGVIFYNIFPAAGPAHLFGPDFPWHALPLDQIPRLQLEPVPINSFRNAIPSLHLAWVLLAWWFSRGMAWWERAFAMFFLVFTVLATLGTGEHYAIDLVASFPFALLLESLFAFSSSLKDRRRWSAIVFGLAAILLWFAGLRFTPHLFWTTPVLPWLLCLATMLVSVYLERRLQATTALHEETQLYPEQGQGMPHPV